MVMETKTLLFSTLPRLSYVLILVLFSLVAAAASGSLSFNFYAASCPTVEFVVANTVRSASSSDPTIPGKLLRLVFHDCFVEVSAFFTQMENLDMPLKELVKVVGVCLYHPPL